MDTTKYPMVSERIEPTMQYIIGNLFMQCEEADEIDMEDACLNLWLGIQCIDRLSTVVCSKKGEKDQYPVHFSIAAGNERSKVASYIEEKLGFNPWFDKEHPTAIRWRGVWR